jgi:protein-L-isoaspartate(D-aspartate) O-methyltransferase
MAAIPRHLFVPEALRANAYGDHALPIEGGQTISQPFMVARQTALLEITRSDRVLEIGAGSGYQTAILAGLAGQVPRARAIAALPSAPSSSSIDSRTSQRNHSLL